MPGGNTSIFFSCIAGQVRDMVGQQLELAWDWNQISPERNQQGTKPTKKQATPTHKPRHGPGKSAREICKLSETRWNIKKSPWIQSKKVFNDFDAMAGWCSGVFDFNHRCSDTRNCRCCQKLSCCFHFALTYQDKLHSSTIRPLLCRFLSTSTTCLAWQTSSCLVGISSWTGVHSTRGLIPSCSCVNTFCLWEGFHLSWLQ